LLYAQGEAERYMQTSQFQRVHNPRVAIVYTLPMFISIATQSETEKKYG